TRARQAENRPSMLTSLGNDNGHGPDLTQARSASKGVAPLLALRACVFGGLFHFFPPGPDSGLSLDSPKSISLQDSSSAFSCRVSALPWATSIASWKDFSAGSALAGGAAGALGAGVAGSGGGVAGKGAGAAAGTGAGPGTCAWSESPW